MRRGIGRLRAGGSGSGTDTDAAAWASAVTAAGGTYSAGTLAAVSAFTVSAKASGYWTKLNRINLFCGNQLAAALVPLKVGGGGATETNVNFVSGDYTEATGLTGNGTTKYLATGLIPSVSLALNDTHIAIYNRSSTNPLLLGAGMGGAAELRVYNGEGGFAISQQYNTGAYLQAAIGTPYGFVIGSRTAAASHALYRNGGAALVSEAVSSGALPTIDLYVFAGNTSGAASQIRAGICAGYSIGTGLTAGETVAYNTHMQTFQTALGRNV